LQAAGPNLVTSRPLRVTGAGVTVDALRATAAFQIRIVV